MNKTCDLVDGTPRVLRLMRERGHGVEGVNTGEGLAEQIWFRRG
jgi:hypothetical protein